MKKHFLSALLTVFGTVVGISNASAVSFIPSELLPGDEYRLVFVTQGRSNATSSNINTYNNFVTNTANAPGAVGNLLEQADLCVTCEWKAIASTATVNAIDNTSTNFDNVNKGVPIYLVSDSPNMISSLTKIADNYEDLWDGSLDASIDRSERGIPQFQPTIQPSYVWTGTDSGGMAKPGVLALGSNQSSAGFYNFSGTTGGPLDERWIDDSSGLSPFPSGFNLRVYGISEILTVKSNSVPEPSSLIGLGMLTTLAIGTNFKRKLNKAKKK